MYLTKLILNPRNSATRRDLAVPYELHRTLMRGIDGHTDVGRMLFRIEPERGQEGPIVLVQSIVPPDWQRLLKNGYLLRADGPKKFSPELKAGQMLRFRLTANPVKKVGGRRIPLTHSVAKREHDKTYWNWLDRRATLAGFEVLHANDAPFHYSPERGKHRYEKAEIPHFAVRFEGVLRVINATKLLDAVERGIGPAKAFGFGLLSLAPV